MNAERKVLTELMDDILRNRDKYRVGGSRAPLVVNQHEYEMGLSLGLRENEMELIQPFTYSDLVAMEKVDLEAWHSANERRGAHFHAQFPVPKKPNVDEVVREQLTFIEEELGVDLSDDQKRMIVSFFKSAKRGKTMHIRKGRKR